MSRIGLQPISVPDKVQVDIRGSHVTVKGPKGELKRSFNPDMAIELEDGVLRVERPTDHRNHKALHGLTRSLLANMVTGVSEGYTKVLDIVGTGYRAEMQGEKLVLHLGYSHPIEFEAPEGIAFEVPQGWAERRSSVASTRNWWARSRPAFAGNARLNPTRAKASAIRASTYGARRARRAGSAVGVGGLMDKAKRKRLARQRRHARVRKRVQGTPSALACVCFAA